MDERILTRHPAGEQGVRIAREKYDVIRAAILDVLRARPESTHTELTRGATEILRGPFEGSIAWYVESVKLDGLTPPLHVLGRGIGFRGPRRG